MADAITNTGFFAWMMDMLRSLAGIRTPFLDSTMSAVTILGEEMAFIVIGLIVLWCFDKKFGYRFLFMYIAGTFVNQFLKAIFMIPRPWVIDRDFQIVESARDGASGWSFPSGHTQSAVLLYGGLARRIKKGWAYIAAVLLVLIVGFSRMYLGVHTLLDVGVSVVTGIIIIIICEALFNRIGDSAGAYSVVTAVVAALCLGLIVFILSGAVGAPEASQVKDAAVLFGTAFGLFAGSFVEMRWIRFETKAAWWAQIIKAVLGLGIILGLRIVLKPLLALISDSPLMDCARYFIMSFVAIAVYPLLFRFFAATSKKA